MNKLQLIFSVVLLLTATQANADWGSTGGNSNSWGNNNWNNDGYGSGDGYGYGYGDGSGDVDGSFNFGMSGKGSGRGRGDARNEYRGNAYNNWDNRWDNNSGYGRPYGPGPGYGYGPGPQAAPAPQSKPEVLEYFANYSSDKLVSGTDQYYPKILIDDSNGWEKPTDKVWEKFKKGCPNCMTIPNGPETTEPLGITSPCKNCMEIPGGPDGTTAPAFPGSPSRGGFLDIDKFIALSNQQTNICELPEDFKPLGVKLYKKIVNILSGNQASLRKFKYELPNGCPRQTLNYLLKQHKELT